MNYYFSGQGRVYAAIRDGSGIPGGFTDFGNCSSLELKLGVNLSLYATGGSQTPAVGVRSGEPPSLIAAIDNLSTDNLAMLLYGVNTAVAQGTVTGESVIGHVGKMTPLANINLSSFTSLTNVGASITYVNGVDYTVNLATGSFFVPATGSAITDAESLVANYVKNASTKVAPGTVAPAFQWLRFEGLNTANGNDPVVVDVYKVRFYPMDVLPLIGDAIVASPVTARIFYDPVQSDTTTDGRMIRIRKL